MHSRDDLIEMLEMQREMLRRSLERNPVKTISASMFPKQRAFFLDERDITAADCSRRAGKSWVLADDLIRDALTPPFGAMSYLALTRSSAKDIFWEPLKERVAFWGLAHEVREGDLSVRFPNKSRIRLYGADQDKVARRLRGNKHKKVAIDEAAFFGGVLQTLIEDVIEPSLADLDGKLRLTSSPGPIPRGYYYEFINNPKACSTHRWTAADNPHIPHWEVYCQRILERRGWTKETPKFMREYLGLWVHDYESLFYSFHRGVNSWTGPLPSGCKWHNVLGLDFGWHDATALSLLSFSYEHPDCFVRKTLQMRQKTISEIAPVVRKWVDLFAPVAIVADTGGLGKSLVEEMRRRYELPIEAAEKKDKLAIAEFINADFRSQRVWVMEGNDPLMEQYEGLLKDPDTGMEVDGIPNDMTDATLYGYRKCCHYHGRTIDPIEPGSERDWERREAEFLKQIVPATGDEDESGEWV